MFTGIIEEAGVERIQPAAKSIELTVRAAKCGRGLKLGDSLAVNGCCLTAVKLIKRGKSTLVQFDLLQETWKRTNLQFAKPGSLVNLERPLRANAVNWAGTNQRTYRRHQGKSSVGNAPVRITCSTSPRRRR